MRSKRLIDDDNPVTNKPIMDFSYLMLKTLIFK